MAPSRALGSVGPRVERRLQGLDLAAVAGVLGVAVSSECSAVARTELSAVASLLALAVRSRREARVLERRNEEAEALVAFGIRLARAGGLDRIAQIAVDKATQILGAQIGALFYEGVPLATLDDP